MASPVDSIAQYIATDLNLGTLATSVFENYTPATPDNLIVVYDTGGRPPSLTQKDDTDEPSVQIRCRNLDAGQALANLQTIFQALHGQASVSIHGTFFKLIEAKQSNPVPLGRDENQRFDFIQNYSAMVSGVNR